MHLFYIRGKENLLGHKACNDPKLAERRLKNTFNGGDVICLPSLCQIMAISHLQIDMYKCYLLTKKIK